MITLIAFFFVLSFLVIVHELGHYAVAKLGGIGVERFSVGYPPRLFGVRIGETDYCVSAIPFGGYVKLTGQEDFQSEEETLLGEKDFRGKPAQVRFLVLAAGSLMNILTAMIIFMFLFFFNGVPESSTIVGFVQPGTLAEEMGFRSGDEIVSVNGKPVERVEDILLPLFSEDNVSVIVRTDGDERVLSSTRTLDHDEDIGILPYVEAKIGSVLANSPAEKAGFQAGDVIDTIDGEHVFGWYHMSTIIRAIPDKTVRISVLREGGTIEVPVAVGHVEEEKPDGSKETIGRIGITPAQTTRTVGLIESAALSVRNTGYLIVHMLDFFGKLFTGRMSMKLIGGPVMIAQLAGESARSGLANLLAFTAFISINLGVLNLLPFPVLDGGHIFIMIIETCVRRKLSYRMRMAIQQVGSLVLLFLMLYITFNDIMRFDAISRFFSR